jgi:UDP-2,4-diacetamido-2,4,6-trideoxy-beta-L-altropyranose hydrolase
MGKTLLIRADASVAMGTGHIMRMIALAQAWREDGGETVFLCAEITPALEKRVRTEGFGLETSAVVPGGIEDLEVTCSVISRLGSKESPVVVALDGYQFGSDFQRVVKATGCRLLFVDDYGHADFYHADLVLNQSASADSSLYERRDPGTQLLLGPRYALLREEFLCRPSSAETDSAPAAGAPPRLLVTLGGSDPDNVTGTVVSALARIPDVAATVVVGGSNPNLESLRAMVAAAGPSFRLEIDARDMPALMAGADIAISAGGSTLWELAFMGIPALVVTTAANQEASVAALACAGAIAPLGRVSDATPERLAEGVATLISDRLRRHGIALASRSLVDGRGVERVTERIKQRHP